MPRKLSLILIILILFGGVYYFYSNSRTTDKIIRTSADIPHLEDEGTKIDNLDPLTIESLRKGEYPGSEIKIEEAHDPGSNYDRFIASYQSDGNKIYALLTIPRGDSPAVGWPAIIFNHGYIPPSEYRTTERYIAYVDGFASQGYVIFKPDYRGHGKSEGEPSGAYGSNGYTIDVLNAVSSIKRFKGVNPEKIGMWGHSLGGFLTLRSMVISKDIKAGVIWAGVVGSYPDLLNNWRRSTFTPPPLSPGVRRWRQILTEKYGTPEQNPTFWNSISANSYLKDLSGPLQLHHGTADASVPVEFSQKLEDQLKKERKTVEAYTYSGDDHNLAGNFNTAMQRSVEFFEKYLKK